MFSATVTAGGLRLVGMRAVMVMGMAQPVAVTVAVAAEVFVWEGLGCCHGVAQSRDRRWA